MGVQQQLVVQPPLVANGGSVRAVGAVALDGHRQPTLHVLREVHVPKCALAQAAGMGQVRVGHQGKPSGTNTSACRWGSTSKGVLGWRSRCRWGGRWKDSRSCLT